MSRSPSPNTTLRESSESEHEFETEETPIMTKNQTIIQNLQLTSSMLDDLPQNPNSPCPYTTYQRALSAISVYSHLPCDTKYASIYAYIAALFSPPGQRSSRDVYNTLNQEEKKIMEFLVKDTFQFCLENGKKMHDTLSLAYEKTRRKYQVPKVVPNKRKYQKKDSVLIKETVKLSEEQPEVESVVGKKNRSIGTFRYDPLAIKKLTFH